MEGEATAERAGMGAQLWGTGGGFLLSATLETSHLWRGEDGREGGPLLGAQRRGEGAKGAAQGAGARMGALGGQRKAAGRGEGCEGGNGGERPRWGAAGQLREAGKLGKGSAGADRGAGAQVVAPVGLQEAQGCWEGSSLAGGGAEAMRLRTAVRGEAEAAKAAAERAEGRAGGEAPAEAWWRRLGFWSDGPNAAPPPAPLSRLTVRFHSPRFHAPRRRSKSSRGSPEALPRAPGERLLAVGGVGGVQTAAPP